MRLTNIGNPDQTPRSAASDLGLRRLSMPHKKDARLIWVNKHKKMIRSECIDAYVFQTTLPKKICRYICCYFPVVLFECVDFSCLSHYLSPSYTVTIQAPIHHDSSRFETDGKIELHRDASGWKKKEIQASIRCLTMLLRCQHDLSTDPLRLMTAALRFTTVELRMLTNAHDASTIRYGASTIQAGIATVASRPPTNLHYLVVVMRQSQGGGGGGYSHFFFIRRLGPSIYRSPPPPPKKKKKKKKKKRNFKNPQKYLKF